MASSLTIIETSESQGTGPPNDEAQVYQSRNGSEKPGVHSVHEDLGRPIVIFSKRGLVHPERPDEGASDHEIPYCARRQPSDESPLEKEGFVKHVPQWVGG